VTPKKTESVSRLELAACVIATRLGCSIDRAYGVPTKENSLLDRFNELFVLNQFKHVQSQDSRFEQRRRDPHLFRGVQDGVPEETSDLLISKAQEESPLCQSALDWEWHSCRAT
jgi:hypothetical protein